MESPANLLLQRTSELAIRAMLFLAQQAPGKLSPVHEIASHYGVSEAYLAKILQRLASCGLVRSFRGPGKGMELGRAPDVISLAAVIRAVEGARDTENCVLGLGVCCEDNPCALHAEWLPLRTAINNLLEKTTLADLVDVLQRRSAGPDLRFVEQRCEAAQASDALERKRL